MANCVFIDTVTTMNDLFGSHDCPVMFRAEVFTGNDSCDVDVLEGETVTNSRTICMLPDEPIPIGGGVQTGVFQEDIGDGKFGNWVKLETGLTHIRSFLEKLNSSDVFVAGYSLKGLVLRNLNETFARVLKCGPVVMNPEKTIDVEQFAKAVYDVRDVGNFRKETIYKAARNEVFRYSPEKNPLSEKMRLTRLVFTSLALKKFGKVDLAGISGFLDGDRSCDVFRMGRYKGCRIDDVARHDHHYLSWVLKNKSRFETDEDMIKTISDVLNREDS